MLSSNTEVHYKIFINTIFLVGLLTVNARATETTLIEKVSSIHQRKYYRARQQNCSTINALEDLDGKYHEMYFSPQNQQDFGWCGNFAAADLIWQATGFRPSVAQIAVNSLEKMTNSQKNSLFISYGAKNELWEGTFVGPALEGMRKQPICSHNDVPFPTEDGVFSFSAERLGRELTILRNAENKITKPHGCRSMNALNLQTFFPNIKNIEDIYKVIEETAKKSISQSINGLLGKGCNYKEYPTMNYRVSNFKLNQEMGKPTEIDKMLESTPKRISSISVQTDEIFKGSKHSAHAMTIIGRKEIGNQCYYQVRNTWGKGCKDAYKSPPIICDQSSAETGTFWLQRDLVKKITFDAHAISTK